MKIYLASQLFTSPQREYNSMVTRRLEEVCSVFLPQRDGTLLRHATKPGSAPQIRDIETIFKTDTGAMDECDAIVAILDGTVIDDGVSWELGYAYAKGKDCYGLLLDDRQAMCSWRNPMIEGCLAAEFMDLDSLVGAISDLAKRSGAEARPIA